MDNKTSQQQKLVIGLTGGIASGKSEVAKKFSKLGVEVIDADQIVHQLLQPGTPQHKTVLNYFGDTIIHHDGTINRSELRKIIINNKDHRQWLEQLIHPAVRKIMANSIAVSHAPYIILVIPLLIENWPHPLINRVLVVDVDEAIQKQRIQLRDHVSAQQAAAIMACQTDRQQRLIHADDSLHNQGTLAELTKKVEDLHHYYLALSQKMAG